MHVIIHILVFLIGIPGNLLVLCVYWSKPVRTSTHILINALAVLDLSTCVFQTFHLLWVFRIVQTPIVYEIYFCCLDTLVCSTLFVTVGIAFDRFEAISRPHRRFLTTFRTRIFIGTTFWVAVMIFVPVSIINILPNQSDLECKLLWIIVYDISIAVGIICFVVIISLYVKIYMNVRKRGRVCVAKIHHRSATLQLADKQEGLIAELPKGSQIGQLGLSCILGNPGNKEPSETKQPVVINVIPYQGSLESVASSINSAPHRVPLHGDSLHTHKSQQRPWKVQSEVSKSSSSDKQVATSISSQDRKEFGLPLCSQQSLQSDSCSSLKPSDSIRQNYNFANPRESIREVTTSVEAKTSHQLGHVDLRSISESRKGGPHSSETNKTAPSKGHKQNFANPRDSISDRENMNHVEAKTSHQLGSPLAVALRSISQPSKKGPRPIDTNKNMATSPKPWTTAAEPNRPHQRQHHQRASRVKFKTTAMLIATTAVFFTTWIPFTSLAIRAQVVYCTQETDDKKDLFDLLSHIIFMNSIANPFIYSVANANFRQNSARVLHKIKVACCCCTS